MTAPSCPISIGQASPTARVWSPMERILDQVNRLPRAHDLPSAITLLNAMNNIITQLNRAEPQVNNLWPQGEGGGGVILKGQEFGQKYGPSDYVLESREYIDQKAINPDDNDQYIVIPTLKMVTFINTTVGESLEYDGEGSGRRTPT